MDTVESKLGHDRMETKINSLTIVVPAFNEAAAIPATIASLLEVCRKQYWKLIIVNDGSTDNTQDILDSFKDQPLLTTINHKLNRGYGGAIKSGIMAVDTDYLVTFDADGQHDVADIENMMKALLDSDADLVIGARGRSLNSYWYRSLGKWIIKKVAGFVMPISIHDLNSGFKLYRTEYAKDYFLLCPNSMAFSDVMTLIFLNEHRKVVEHPIQVHPRIGGTSKISTKTAFETILEILNVVMLLAPLRIFLPMSIMSFVIGLGWGIPFVISGRGVSVGSMLAIVTALILFTLGLVSEQLSQLRRELLVSHSNHTGSERP